ncbi:unnamed protein product [Peniophora sp. CBMAI 1063]|nr:unnamed protein product [Peniophora sp. CBMAI 1063]
MSSTPGAGPSRRIPTASKPFSSTFSLPSRRAPQSSKGRLNTFADASSLRLHLDGSRVPADPSSAFQGKGLVAKSLKNAGPDARGRWYARDATGSAKVPRERRVREADETEAAVQEELRAESVPAKGKEKEVFRNETSEVFDLNADAQVAAENGKEVDAEEVVDEKELRRRERRRKDNESRRLKRARFKEDLRTGRDLVLDTPTLPKDESLPPPDFLKVIHHFASNYYAHAGVLTDKSREYRAIKKARAERRTARLFEQGKEELDEEDTDSSREEDAATSSSRPSKRARRSRSMSRVTRSSRSSSPRSYSRSTRADDEAEDEEKGMRQDPLVKQPDMYKAFSGKGLMAIGILMQEFIAAQVTREPPEDWLESALLEGKILEPDSEISEAPQDPPDEEDKEVDEGGSGGLDEDSEKDDEDDDIPRSSDDEKSSSSPSEED